MPATDNMESPQVLDWCRRLFGGSRDPYALLDAQGRYLWFNDAGTALFGYTLEEAQDRSIWDDLTTNPSPDGTFAKALGGTPAEAIRHIRTKGGTVAPVLAELLPAGDGLVLAHATDMREVFSDIHDLRSNTVLDALLASSTDAIWLMDNERRVAQINASAAALLRSLTGTDGRIGVPIGDNLPIDQRDEFRRLIASAYAGQPMNTVRSFTGREGLTRHFHIHAFPMTSRTGAVLGVACVAREVTGQVEAEYLARTRLGLLTHAEAIAQTGTWTYRPATGHVEWTDGIYRLADLPVDHGPDIEGFLTRVHPDDRARVRHMVDERRGNSSTFMPSSYRLLLPSGAVRWLEEFVSVERDMQGGIAVLTGTLQDVTERIAAEERTRQAERTDAIGRVVAGIAHDLNNYLSAILGPIELIRAGDPRREYWLSMADASARRAASVVRELVQLVRPDPPHFERFALDSAIGDAIDAAAVTPEPVLERAGEAFEFTGDRQRIVQVLTSLLTNAGEAVHARGADTPGYIPAISLQVSANSEWLSLVVRDNGVGMEDEARRRALDPYFSTKQGGHRAGLGLAIAHRTVIEHRGRMDIHSTPGAGTTVTVTFPRTLTSTVDDHAPAASGARILVVDDESAVRDLEVAVLADAGHSAVAVASGDAAIEACRREPFDLVLLNMHMPGRNGLETLTVLQSEHPSLRVAMVTGSDIEEQIATRRVAGLVRKPWTSTELVNAVRTFL